MTQGYRFVGPAVLTALGGVSAWAQTSVTPTPSVPPGGPGVGVPGPAPADGGSSALILIVAIVAVIVVIGAIARFYDLRRRREAEAVDLQARLSDTLLTDPGFLGTSVTPTVHVPLKGSPVVIEVAGDVPTPELRDRALRAVREQAERARRDVLIEDKVSVMPPVPVSRAA